MYFAPGIISSIEHQFTYWVSIRARGSRLSKVTQKPLSTDRNYVSRGKVGNFQNAYFYVKWQTVTLSPIHRNHFGDDTKSNQMLSQQFNPGRQARNSKAECFPVTGKQWLGNTQETMNQTPRTCLNGSVKLLGPGNAESGFFSFFFCLVLVLLLLQGWGRHKATRQMHVCQVSKDNMKLMDITAQHSFLWMLL